MTEAPLSTYRLQLGPDLTFGQAAELAPYLAGLGVTHLYLSPVLRAVPGSTHGYDVADPSLVAPELGGEEGLRALADTAHGLGLGIVADIVPNHVGVHATNPLWDDLLATGPAGDAARVFDVNWESALPASAQKVILPVLGGQYGQVLHDGEFTVERDPGRGWRLRYHDHDFPLSAETAEALDRSGAEALRGTPGDAESWQRLHALIERQHYRLVYWRVGHRLINYRRFFAVNTLAAVRVEDPEVFARTHGTILRLVRDEVIDGLRVDHPDGLRDPARYLDRLCEAAGGAWIVVEKIVHSKSHGHQPGHGEQPETLRDWPVAGTTGYEFCNDVLGLFVDPAAEAALDALDQALGGTPDAYAAMSVAAKRQILAEDLASEHQRLTGALWRLAQEHPAVRDLDDRDVAEAIAAVIAELDVYRPYVDPEHGRASAEDVARVDAAAERARAGSLVPQEVFDLVAGAASGRLGTSAPHLDFAARFAQLSSAVMAKGVEDTLLYRYQRLLALNEVGGSPAHLGLTAPRFHELNAERAARHPAAMLTTATHDTKRGEDVRLRMAAISARVEQWAALVGRWADGAPDGQAATLVLQTLAGVWPLAADEPDEDVRRRVHAYLVKAMREARLRTDWSDPDERYERAVAEWLDRLLDDPAFVADFGAEVRPLQEIGMVAGLAQVLLRCTAPGVPDTYQGCELWEDLLVDPDNRRPVDFALRRRLLDELGEAPDVASLWHARRDGRVKLWVLSRALRARNAHPGCFGPEGAYEPLTAEGELAGHVVAFARTAPDGDAAVAIAPRLPGRVIEQGWSDTTVTLPPGQWHDLLTGILVSTDRPLLRDLTATLPVALLTRT
jgi:(1->4)-alpha-D-glucan 1-alpha-D-glucosylmutase